MMTSLTLTQLAERLGVDQSTLRHQIRNGSLKATKFGSIWVVSIREADRYASQSLGRHHGRPARKGKRKVAK